MFCNPCIDWAKSEVSRIRERKEYQTVQNPPPPPPSPQIQFQSHYSPVSDTHRRTLHPFQGMADPMLNDPLLQADNAFVAQRLANPNGSPLRLNRKYTTWI